MAHTGRLDGSAHDAPREQDQESSHRQDIKMMNRLIHMMKQQLQELRVPPPSKKEILVQHEDQ
eukprot:796547-Prorocentrum_lima.AAC.1